jgi:outer membrane protein assembly factor BamB
MMTAMELEGQLKMTHHRFARRRLLRPCGMFALCMLSACAGAQTGVFTYHNHASRTGANTSETVLNPGNVNSARFEKLFSHRVDGDVYAQPLYVPQVPIPGKGKHNVIVVATQADSIYAFDADSIGGANSEPLWQASLVDATHGTAPGSTAVKVPAELACFAIIPQVGITSTPVIDPGSGVIYVEAFSKEKETFVHRLHALDIRDGSERLGGPVVVTGTASREGSGPVVFDPLHQLNRAGLLLLNGIVYVAYGSHCDKPPTYGWLFAYDASNLSQKGVFVTAPTYGKAGIWMSGAGLAADDQGNIFVATGDGWFDTNRIPARDLGNTIVKTALNQRLFAILDYFTPFDQARLSRHDQDLGSGGVLLLPDQPGGHTHLLAQVGKEGTLYVVDRDRMTAGNLHYCAGCASDTQIVQELPRVIPGGVWGMPAYWNGNVFVSGSRDVVRAFSLRNGLIAPTPHSVSREICRYPGCGLAISANGDKDGILWALEVGSYDSKGPAVLKAYDAENLAHLLYSSDQNGEQDRLGGAIKFSVPTIVNGKVYVGSSTQLTVFGLSRP